MRREITSEQKKALIDEYKREYNPDFFKKKLKEILKEKNMTQKELAEEVGILPTAFTKYFSGANRPSFRNMSEMAHVLGVDQRSLYTEEYYNEKKQADEDFQCCEETLNAIYEEEKPLIEYLKSIGYKVEPDYDNVAFFVFSPEDKEWRNPIPLDYQLADRLGATMKKYLDDIFYIMDVEGGWYAPWKWEKTWRRVETRKRVKKK